MIKQLAPKRRASAGIAVSFRFIVDFSILLASGTRDSSIKFKREFD
jgi:hypothetical protein